MPHDRCWNSRIVYLLTHHCCITNSAGPCAGYGNFGIKVIGYTPYGSYWVGQADAGNGTASPVYVQNAPQATLFTLDPTSCALSSVSAPGSQQAGTANQLYDFTTTSGYAPWMAATTVPSNGARIICYPGADGISLTCHNGLGMTSSSPCVDVSGVSTLLSHVCCGVSMQLTSLAMSSRTSGLTLRSIRLPARMSSSPWAFHPCRPCHLSSHAWLARTLTYSPIHPFYLAPIHIFTHRVMPFQMSES